MPLQLARLIPLPKNIAMRFLTLILIIAAFACKNKPADNGMSQELRNDLLGIDTAQSSATAVQDTQNSKSPYVFMDTILVSLGAKDFAAVTKSKPNMPILDLRPENLYKIGHVWRSTHLDANGPDFNKTLAGLSRTQEYAVYCMTGEVSLRVAEEMKRMGFMRIYHLQKGLVTWGESGQALQLK